ncbi:MAG: sulfite exporter TauE/SafE family protein [Candidatus Brocadiia bacterium]
MSLCEMLVLASCCVAASVTQSLSSFGFGLVLVALLPVFGFPIEDTVVLVTLLVIPNILIALWRLRGQASLRRVGWLLAGVPVGLPAGITLLKAGPEALLRGLLGAVLVFMAVEPFVRRRLGPAPAKRSWAFLAGACSGALGGALSTGGPPVVVYFYRRRWSKELTKASVILTFAGTVAFRLVGYGVSDAAAEAGLLTVERVVTAAAFCPAVVAGTLAGERLFRSVSQGRFRQVVGGLLVVCGVYQLQMAIRLAAG